MRNLPNYLTIGRLMALPILIMLMFMAGDAAAWAALGLYTVCCITDWLDGYIARAYQVESPFGKFLDPVSDKIFVAAVLVTLLANGHLPWWGSIPVIIILSREFLISGLREFFGPKNIRFPVSKLAKWKTTVQMFSLGFLIVGESGEAVYAYNWETGYVLLVVAAILTMLTGWSYLKEGARHFHVQ